MNTKSDINWRKKCVSFFEAKMAPFFVEKILPFLRKNAVVIVLLLLYVFFYRFWEDLIGRQLIDKFLCHFESNWLNDIIFFAIVVVLSLSTLIFRKNTNNKQLKSTSFLICFIILGFWLYYRCFYSLCGLEYSSFYMYFTPLRLTKSVRYIDIVPFIVLCYLVSHIGPLYSIQFEKTGFIQDSPITTINDDKFQRWTFAHDYIVKIINTDTHERAFTFGIDSPWGAGKSSLINLMKDKIDNLQRYSRKKDQYKDITVIDFNPWLYAAEKDLVTVFFDELSKVITGFDHSIAKNLTDYAKLLSALNTKETKSIASLINFAYRDNTLQEKSRQL